MSLPDSPDINPLVPTEAEWSARRSRLVSELRPAPARRRRTGRRVTVLVAATLGVTAAGVGAAEMLSAEDVNVPAGIGCYDRLALEANTTIIGATKDPVATCAGLWREGVVDGRPRESAPPLVACTGKGQPVRVMPGRSDADCASLGLAPLPDGYDEVVDR